MSCWNDAVILISQRGIIWTFAFFLDNPAIIELLHHEKFEYVKKKTISYMEK